MFCFMFFRTFQSKEVNLLVQNHREHRIRHVTHYTLQTYSANTDSLSFSVNELLEHRTRHVTRWTYIVLAGHMLHRHFVGKVQDKSD